VAASASLCIRLTPVEGIRHVSMIIAVPITVELVLSATPVLVATEIPIALLLPILRRGLPLCHSRSLLARHGRLSSPGAALPRCSTWLVPPPPCDVSAALAGDRSPLPPPPQFDDAGVKLLGCGGANVCC